jgi:hypothetical protein
MPISLEAVMRGMEIAATGQAERYGIKSASMVSSLMSNSTSRMGGLMQSATANLRRPIAVKPLTKPTMVSGATASKTLMPKSNTSVTGMGTHTSPNRVNATGATHAPGQTQQALATASSSIPQIAPLGGRPPTLSTTQS